MENKIKKLNEKFPTGTKVRFSLIERKKKLTGQTLSEVFTNEKYPQPSVYVEGVIGAVSIAQLKIVSH